jgi:hypothetical protein
MSLTQTIPSVADKQRPQVVSAPDAAYNVSIGYLRAFIIVLVVAHHTALAYANVRAASGTIACSATAVVAGVPDCGFTQMEWR